MFGAAFGFATVVLIGAASADETPTSVPAQPDTSLAPAVVVAAGADTLDTNAVIRITAYSATKTQTGTAFWVDDGRVATVAHALVDARGIGLGEPDDRELFALDGPDAIESSIDSLHDVAAFIGSGPSNLAVSFEPLAPGDSVALAGFARDERIEVITGHITSRGPGTDYGIARPDIYAISAEVTAGWSGGPVVNSEGEVVAVVIGLETTSGITIAVPIEYLPRP